MLMFSVHTWAATVRRIVLLLVDNAPAALLSNLACKRALGCGVMYHTAVIESPACMRSVLLWAVCFGSANCVCGVMRCALG